MILGVGADICDIERMREAIERQGERLLSRLFTAAERAHAEACPDPSAAYAARFAAKEACGKALGTGLTARVRWIECEVVAAKSGGLGLRLAGGALRRARWLAGRSRAFDAALSIAFAGDHATAFVLLQRLSETACVRDCRLPLP